MSQVKGYMTRRGRRVRPYLRNGHGVVGLRHSATRNRRAPNLDKVLGRRTPYAGRRASSEFMKKFFYGSDQWGSTVKEAGPNRQYGGFYLKPPKGRKYHFARQLTSAEHKDMWLREEYHRATGRVAKGGSAAEPDIATYLHRTGQPQLPAKLPKARGKRRATR